jgi:hypothetical protein
MLIMHCDNAPPVLFSMPSARIAMNMFYSCSIWRVIRCSRFCSGTLCHLLLKISIRLSMAIGCIVCRFRLIFMLEVGHIAVSYSQSICMLKVGHIEVDLLFLAISLLPKSSTIYRGILFLINSMLKIGHIEASYSQSISY